MTRLTSGQILWNPSLRLWYTCSVAKDIFSFSDFQKLDLRVGKVISAARKEGSRNLIRLEVDFGNQGKKTLLAGIADWYKPEELEGKKYAFVYNLEPKKMMDETSDGMILAADTDGRAYLLEVDDKVPQGARIV